MELGHWKTSLTIEADMFGFIYRITCKPYARHYIGKKICNFSVVRKPLKGLNRRRRSTVTSDWMTYTGSCAKLNADIKELGKEQFVFEIIKACKSKAELAYYEAEAILQANALQRADYYNEYLQVRLRVKKDSVRKSE
jgi:Putative endonuclease segE, GIY-YIG domain